MKKILCVILAVSMLLCCLCLPSAAQTEEDPVIRLRLNSDVAGCTEADFEKIVEILSPQVVYRTDRNGNSPINISNACGESPRSPLEAGRKYTFTCSLVAAEGYTLPDTLAEGDVVLECGKGIKVISCRVADVYVRRTDEGEHITEKTLLVFAQLIVDGNIFQRMIGLVRDLILRIKAWSLY